MLIIAYLLVASVSVFCFCVGKKAANIGRGWDSESEYYTPCIIWGVIWPLGWVAYAPFLAAVWFVHKEGYK